MAQLRDSYGAGEITQCVTAQVDQPRIGRQAVFDQFLGDPRHDGLAAVRQIAKSRRLVDGRSRVIAFVAQLNVTGVHAHPKSDRRHVATLQIQRAGDRVACMRERGHETVAFALFDRSNPAMFGDQLPCGAVEQRDGCRHRVGLGLPQLGGTLDVGEQQRHRPRRKQLGHVNLGPLSCAHASQRAAGVDPETSAQRRIYALITWDLRRTADDLAVGSSDSRCMTTTFAANDRNLRKVVPGTLGPRRDDRLCQSVAAVVTARMDRFRTADPLSALCAALGVPRDDWKLMRRWADRIGAPADPLYAYLDVMVADRCRSLGDDLLSDLILTEAGGDELTAEELRALVVTLLVQAHRAGVASSGTSDQSPWRRPLSTTDLRYRRRGRPPRPSGLGRVW